MTSPSGRFRARRKINPERLSRGNVVDEIQARLPQEPNSFIGRERDIGELLQILPTMRALTCAGRGASGRRGWPLRAATAAADADAFPDGVCFVELADLREPDLVVSRVAAVAGVSEEAERPLIDTLADALRPRRLLLSWTTASTWSRHAPRCAAACWPARPACGCWRPAASRCAPRRRRSGMCRRCRCRPRAKAWRTGMRSVTRRSGCSPTGPPRAARVCRGPGQCRGGRVHLPGA